MKKICILLILILSLSSVCSGCTIPQYEDIDKETSMFTVIEYSPALTWKVVYHNDTKVMYAVSDSTDVRGTFTLLVNPDGTPMLYERNE